MLKEQNIQEENWDNLIILDACRFDTFNKVYKEYINGKLIQKISKGSYTGEWLINTFPDKYDITYISANPYINSYGIPLNKCRSEYKNYFWNAIDHFNKIIDVWDFGWNKEFDSIHPEQVNEAYLSTKDDNKKIIHYVQPHYPYLSYDGVYETRYKVEILKEGYVKFFITNVFNKRSRSLFWKKILEKINPNYKLSQLEKLYLKIGIDKLLYYYEDNLRIVLQYVSQLIENFNGITIITTDHGEAFREQGIWGHPIEKHIPVLIEVPWLVVKNKKY